MNGARREERGLQAASTSDGRARIKEFKQVLVREVKRRERRAPLFFRVENFPMLGTGKLDLRGVKETAAKLAN